METVPSNQPPVSITTPTGPEAGPLVSAGRFWEPLRLDYNLALGVVTLFWLVAAWPQFRMAVTLLTLLRFAGLALIANLLYCIAYVFDIPLQRLYLGTDWSRLRWGLWLAGTLFAILLTSYWINDEVYPFVR